MCRCKRRISWTQKKALEESLNKRISDEDSDTIGELNKEFYRLQSNQQSDRDELKELERRENELSNDVVRLRKKSGGVDASEDQDVLDTVQRQIKTIEKTLATYREKPEPVRRSWPLKPSWR